MKLVLTLLSRDEEDIVETMLDFHLGHGVDFIIATDNGSRDATRSILKRYQRGGVLLLIDEPRHTHDQGVWVTSMARLAFSRFRADWVINSDADEFWWPRSGNLKQDLADVPESVAALNIERFNFLPPDPRVAGLRPFHESMTLRERVSLTSLGDPLPPKVLHRGEGLIAVTDGNHAVQAGGLPIEAHSFSDIEILHFPARSFAQFERKIRHGTEALERNPLLDPGVGSTWRTIYNEQLLRGRLPEYYAALRPGDDQLGDQIASGDLVTDVRLRDAIIELQVRERRMAA
jgi:hypothetical protein